MHHCVGSSLDPTELLTKYLTLLSLVTTETRSLEFWFTVQDTEPVIQGPAVLYCLVFDIVLCLSVLLPEIEEGWGGGTPCYNSLDWE